MDHDLFFALHTDPELKDDTPVTWPHAAPEVDYVITGTNPNTEHTVPIFDDDLDQAMDQAKALAARLGATVSIEGYNIVFFPPSLYLTAEEVMQRDA